MNRTWITGMCVVAVLISAAGCGNPQIVDASSGAPKQILPMSDLVARSQPPIPDLPVPIGFKIDENKSRDYSFSGARFVDHVYKGDANKLRVKRFYERQMPINRWAITTSMFVRGDIMLDFEKETERCRVIISDSTFLWIFHATYIKVQLWTSGRLETPGQEQK